MKNSKTNSLILYNAIIPIVFFEAYNVLLAFVFVALIETIIISLITKLTFKKLFISVIIANFLTTIIGYFLQILFRFLFFGMLTWVFDSILLHILADSIGLPDHQSTTGIPYEVYLSLIISMLIAFAISVHYEKKYLLKKIDFDKNELSKSILTANIISYIGLFFWILYRYYTI